jgi:hypothetical protein
MNAAFSPSSTCEHVSRSLKSACFVPCESCMAEPRCLAQTGSLPLGCGALCGRGSPRARARSQVRSLVLPEVLSGATSSSAAVFVWPARRRFAFVRGAGAHLRGGFGEIKRIDQTTHH